MHLFIRGGLRPIRPGQRLCHRDASLINHVPDRFVAAQVSAQVIDAADVFLSKEDAWQLLVASIHLQGENDCAFLFTRYGLKIDDLMNEVFFLKQLHDLFSMFIIA